MTISPCTTRRTTEQTEDDRLNGASRHNCLTVLGLFGGRQEARTTRCWVSLLLLEGVRRRAPAGHPALGLELLLQPTAKPSSPTRDGSRARPQSYCLRSVPVVQQLSELGVSVFTHFVDQPHRLALDLPNFRHGLLGRHSTCARVRESGLWNSDHVDENYDPQFLDRFDALVESVV